MARRSSKRYWINRGGTPNKRVWRVFQGTITYGAVLRKQFSTRKAAVAYIKRKGG